jgi:sugar lactone lactonase YvrE
MAESSTQIVVDGLSFPESPRWHDGALWFSDIHGHRVYRLADGVPQVAAEIGDRTSGIGFLPDGSLLVVSMLDRRLIAVGRDGRQRVHADLSHLSRNFINDMVVDAKGRAYVGSRNGGNPATKSDSLLLVEPNGEARVLLDDMVSPNGAVITPDGKMLIIAETALGRLNRFDLAADGSLGDRQIICELAGRHIDGICLDAAGGVWCGGGNGGLLYVAPDGSLGKVIDFPGRMVLACSLGGPGGRTLFLATTSMKLVLRADRQSGLHRRGPDTGCPGQFGRPDRSDDGRGAGSRLRLSSTTTGGNQQVMGPVAEAMPLASSTSARRTSLAA